MGTTELKLEVDAALLEQARRADIPLDQAFEVGLKLALAQSEESRPLDLTSSARRKAADPTGAEARAGAWARENAEAIESYNERIKRRGIFGEDLRRW